MQLPVGSCGPEWLQWLGFYLKMTKTSVELTASPQEHQFWKVGIPICHEFITSLLTVLTVQVN